MLCVLVPITLGVYVDVHVAGLLAVNVHAVNVPVPLLASAIVPPGALCGPMSVSVTLTVQVLASFTGIEPGAQLTTVVVLPRTVSVTSPRLLSAPALSCAW